ncbi:hypothetical protein AAF712_002874 [Marasmius tenuissimus]|uniref:NmrA-like domain-containing protein n=1 Tax=Marasmius tenuissimus TaxID=585030 RepID=A0ABR3A7L8_9AGAR|nr:hypothetical protein PM082_000472 [Marasmius tenuissimus]
MSSTQPKVVLVAGATGKQGRATISALLKGPNAQQFRILALTRNASSSAAKRLSTDFPERLTVVEGDLSTKESLRAVFERSRAEGTDIWGVFAVMAYPGLGVDSAGEEMQGKNLAEAAHENKVGCFVYTSLERAGEMFDEEAPPGSTHAAKVKIERRIKELGLPWTILRPTRFMENFQGQMGGLGWSIFSVGLKPTTTLHLIAADDIGHTAAGVFQNPDMFKSQVLVLRGDDLTSPEQFDIYRKAVGRNISSIPNFVARGILRMNAHLQEMIELFEKTSAAVAEGKVPDFEGQLELARKAAALGGGKLTTFEEWAIASVHQKNDEGWNKVSLLSLFTGRH